MRESCTERRARFTERSSRPGRDRRATDEEALRDSDTVVYEEIHSLGLERDIPGVELVWVRNLGHKPDWIAPDLVAAAVEKVAGVEVDLQTLGREVEARIAGQAFGPFEKCRDGRPIASIQAEG